MGSRLSARHRIRIHFESTAILSNSRKTRGPIGAMTSGQAKATDQQTQPGSAEPSMFTKGPTWETLDPEEHCVLRMLGG